MKQLTVLTLHGTRFTSEGIKRLHELLKDCYIGWMSPEQLKELENHGVPKD
jgi:hypothetical protein